MIPLIPNPSRSTILQLFELQFQRLLITIDIVQQSNTWEPPIQNAKLHSTKRVSMLSARIWSFCPAWRIQSITTGTAIGSFRTPQMSFFTKNGKTLQRNSPRHTTPSEMPNKNSLDRRRLWYANLAGWSLRDIVSRSNVCELCCGSVNLVLTTTCQKCSSPTCMEKSLKQLVMQGLCRSCIQRWISFQAGRPYRVLSPWSFGRYLSRRQNDLFVIILNTTFPMHLRQHQLHNGSRTWHAPCCLDSSCICKSYLLKAISFLIKLRQGKWDVQKNNACFDGINSIRFCSGLECTNSTSK